MKESLWLKRYKGRIFTFDITRSDEETSSAGGMDCSAEVVSVLPLVRSAKTDRKLRKLMERVAEKCQM